MPVHGFRTLPAGPGALARNTVAPCPGNARPFRMITRPMPLQAKAFDRLGPLMGGAGRKRARSGQTVPVDPLPETSDLFRIGDVR